MPAVIRALRPEDVAYLEQVENDADRLLVDLFEADSWEPAASGASRVAQHGFTLVATEGADPIGFAHVLEVDGEAHLEQLAVSPDHGRRGHGRALVVAAVAEVQRRGHRRLTLRTYADVPWNAPFYRSCGFEESDPDSAFLRQLEQKERRIGLERWGRRVQMTAWLP